MRRFLLMLVLTFPTICQATQTGPVVATMVYEVRTGGVDTNGGCFDSAAAGTDYSQQNSAQFNGTNLLIDVSTNTKVTSLTHNFVSADVGNCINISAGTSWTAGFYKIVSVSANAATLDRSPSAAGNVNLATWAEGGALLTWGEAMGAITASNIVWIATGSYSVSTTVTIPGSVNDLPNAKPNYILGYNATRGDIPTGSTRPTLTTGTSGLTLLTVTGVNFRVENFIFDDASTGNAGILINSGNGVRGTRFTNIKIANFLTTGFYSVTGGGLVQFEITGGTSCTAGVQNSGDLIDGYIHGNACPGVYANVGSGPQNMTRVIIAGNTGTTGYGFESALDLVTTSMDSCVIYGNSKDGVLVNGSYQSVVIRNSVIYGNTGTGINFTINQGPASLAMNYNAVGGNGTNRTNVTAGPNDVVLSSDPFVSGSTGNFAPATGSAIIGTGYPGAFPGGTTTGHANVGPIVNLNIGVGCTPSLMMIGVECS